MKKFLIVTALFAAFPAFADDLDDSAAICARHPGSRAGPVSRQQIWEPGWEHCSTINEHKIKRDAAKAAVDESKNPELKMTRELARGLVGGSK